MLLINNALIKENYSIKLIQANPNFRTLLHLRHVIHRLKLFLEKSIAFVEVSCSSGVINGDTLEKVTVELFSLIGLLTLATMFFV